MIPDLDDAILSLIARGARANWSDEHEKVALALFRHQYESIPFYREYVNRLGLTPENVSRSEEIPAMPTFFFKRHRIASFSDSERVATFWTTGTTTSERGEHLFDTLALYDHASDVAFRDLTPKRETNPRWISLIPSRIEAPRSSLAHMIDHLSGGKANYENPNSQLVTAAKDQVAVFLATTTVALSDFLDILEREGRRIPLPKESQLFETGGRKGRRYLPTSDELSKRAEQFLNISQGDYLGEYGMTEMSSPSWGRLENGHWIYQCPAWAPVTIVSPKTMKEVALGEEGFVRVLDLANRGSVSALLTGDWGKRYEKGFEILGRVIDSELRGCSLLVGPPPVETQVVQSTFNLSALKEEVTTAKAPPLPQIQNALEKLTEIFLQSESSNASTEGIRRTFAELGRRDILPVESAQGLSLYIYAGNLPVTGVFGFYEALLSGSPSLHRPSSKGGDLLKRLHETLQSIDPIVAARTAIVETPSHDDAATKELFRGATRIVAQGDDETLAHLMTLAPASATFNAQGTKLSGILLDLSRPPTPEEMDAIVQDIFIWEQQGCLSPQVLFVFGKPDAIFIKTLLSIADRRGKDWNRTPSPRAIGRIRWQELTSEDVKFFENDQLTITVTNDVHPEWFSTAGFIQLIPISSIEEVAQILTPYSSHLGALATNLDLKSALGFESVIPLGQLQSPKFQPRG